MTEAGMSREEIEQLAREERQARKDSLQARLNQPKFISTGTPNIESQPKLSPHIDKGHVSSDSVYNKGGVKLDPKFRLLPD